MLISIYISIIDRNFQTASPYILPSLEIMNQQINYIADCHQVISRGMLLQDDVPDDAQQHHPEDTDHAATVQLLQSATVSWQHPVRK